MSRESDRNNDFRYHAVPAAWEAVRPAAISRDCFADEIAIDFPSVGRAVERIREGFLEDQAAPEVLATELRLSMVEARRGLVVPLDVPMRGTCSRCGGRGETWTEPCDPCCGTGASLFQHPVRVSVPAGVADGTLLRFRVTSPHAPSVRVELRVAIRSSAA